jgi:hypothetical protein
MDVSYPEEVGPKTEGILEWVEGCTRAKVVDDYALGGFECIGVGGVLVEEMHDAFARHDTRASGSSK